jgi:serine/threonine protein kinase
VERCRHEDLSIHGQLGEGETFWVQKCEYKKQVYALKHLKLQSQDFESAMFKRRFISVMLELQIMHHQPLRSHPNILSLFGYGWNLQKQSILPYVLVEYSPFGTLREYLQRNERIPMLCKEMLLADVASGLHSLHETGIIHGDVKLDNILVFSTLTRGRLMEIIAKISDFGHSIVLAADKEASAHYSGTPA